MTVSFLGKFHNSRIVFSGLIEPCKLMTIEEKGYINIWDTETGRIINSERFKFNPSFAIFMNDKKYLLIGTQLGALRVFKLDGFLAKNMTEMASIKFNEKEKIENIKIEEKSSYLAVKINKANKIYFCQLNENKKNIDLHGFISLDMEVKDIEWRSDQMEPALLVLLKGGSVLSIPFKFGNKPNLEALSNLNENIGTSFIRRIDSDCDRMISVTSEGHFFAYGNSLVLRKYKLPSDSILKLDIKNRFPQNPLEEFIAFDIYPQVLQTQNAQIYYGTENGEFGCFDFKEQISCTKIVTSFERGGSSYFQFLNQTDAVIGGQDGSVFIIKNFENFLKSEYSKSHLIFEEKPVNSISINENILPEKTKNKKAPKDDKAHQKLEKLASMEMESEAHKDQESNQIEQDYKSKKSIKNKKKSSSHLNANELDNEAQGNFKEQKNSSTKLLSKNLVDPPLNNMIYRQIVTFLLEHLSDNDLSDLNSLLYARHLQSVKEQKELNKKKVLEVLHGFQSELEKLREQNLSLSEEYRITNEEFCIDLEKQQRYKQLSEEVTKEIRERAQKEKVYYELLHQKLKNKTFMVMETHLKGLAGFETKTGVFNFPINKLSQQEQKNFSKLSILRRMEIKEKEWLKEHKNDRENNDFLDRFIVEKQPKFLINAGYGKQKMVLTDFEKREKELKEYEEERRKKNEMLQNANNNNVTRRIELVNRRKRKKKNNLKNFNKQTVESKPGNNENQVQAKNNKDTTQDLDKPHNLIYSTLELTTTFKKINQIYFIKNLIRVIKEEFNVDFEMMFKMREKKLDLINEFQKKIKEICAELQIENQAKELNSNIIEK